ncbi:PREDICTED: THAP domain-containing protein 1-like [Cyphomyrmex costatus]|uniref:THAP domain-containing protein 1-like n=1 Tax=Cyphomyrmex costatus TaxID=456900 RepID=UPI0008522225|nr:PREDICTED: THAP domain-containing protein 1-like [Cyphomyrmex costatus]
MPTCCVPNCKMRTGKLNKMKMYYFPHDPQLRKQWLKACGRTNESELSSRYSICERHFRPECIEERWTEQRANNKLRLMRRVKKDAVPTELLNITKERKFKVKKTKKKLDTE